jgi:hypothetical protein
MNPKRLNEWLSLIIKSSVIIATIGSGLVILRYGQNVALSAEQYLVFGFVMFAASALLVIYAASATLAPVFLWPVESIIARAREDKDLEVREINLFGAKRYQIIGDTKSALKMRRAAMASALLPLSMAPIALIVLFLISLKWEITVASMTTTCLLAMAATATTAFYFNNTNCSSDDGKIKIMSAQAFGFLVRVIGSAYLVLLLGTILVAAVFDRLAIANLWFGSIVLVAATALPLFLGALAAGLKVALPGDQGWRDVFGVILVIAVLISGFFGAEIIDQVAISLELIGEP